MLNLIFNPYRYDIWYNSKLDEMDGLEDDELDKKIDELVAGLMTGKDEFEPVATCNDVESAFAAAKKALEVADFKDYETLHISKINKFTGKTVGNFIYSKMYGQNQTDFIWIPTKESAWEYLKSRVELKIVMLRLTFTINFWLFRKWFSKPLYFIVGILLITYIFIVSPAETLLKVMNRGEEFNAEMDEAMEKLDKPLFITSLFLYAFIIYEIIKHL